MVNPASPGAAVSGDPERAHKVFGRLAQTAMKKATNKATNKGRTRRRRRCRAAQNDGARRRQRAMGNGFGPPAARPRAAEDERDHLHGRRPAHPAGADGRMRPMTSAASSAANASAPRKDPWDLPDVSGLRVGVLGGTGDQGRGLAYRLARAGTEGDHRVARRGAGAAGAPPRSSGTGSRAPTTPSARAAATSSSSPCPWDGHAKTLESLREELAGKLVVDCVNPLGFDKKGAYALKPEEGSAAEQAAALLPDSRVTAAFHHLSAVLLQDPEVEEIDTDVMVLGEERADMRDRAGAGRPHPRHARRLRRPAAQRPPGGVAGRQPDLRQPPLQGPRGPARHRHLRPAAESRGRSGSTRWGSERSPAAVGRSPSWWRRCSPAARSTAGTTARAAAGASGTSPCR